MGTYRIEIRANKKGKMNKKNFTLFILAIVTLETGYTQTIPDLIPYRKGEKWGFVDKDKETIIPFQYDRAAPFSHGLATVRLGDKEGYIDKTGKLVLDTLYIEVGDFENGYAIVGQPWRLYTYEYEVEEDEEDFGSLGGGTYTSASGDPPKYGVIDTKGNIILPEEYTAIYQNQGYFIIGMDSRDEYNVYSEAQITSIYGLANLQGQILVPPKYESVDIVGDKLVCRTFEGMYGCVDFENNLLIPFQYQTVFFLNPESKTFFGEMEDKWYLVRENKPQIELKYDNIYFHSEGLAKVRKDDKWGFINGKGKEVIPISYDEVGGFGEGLIPVQTGLSCAYIDKKNRVQLETSFDQCKTFNSGLAAVKRDDLWGYINRDGEIAIPLKYSRAWGFGKGFALANNSLEELFNSNHRVLVNREGDELAFFQYLALYPFQNGLAKVEIVSDDSDGFQFYSNFESFDYYMSQNPSNTGYIDEFGNIYFDYFQ